MGAPPQGTEPNYNGSRVYIGISGDTTGAKDLTNLTNALGTASRRVELGPGDFYVNKTLPMGKNRTRLIGQGRDMTRINLVGANTNNIIEATAGVTAATVNTDAAPIGGPLSQIAVEDLSLIGDGTYDETLNENLGMGLRHKGCQDSLFRNLYITGFRYYGVYCLTGDASGATEANRSKHNTHENITVLQNGQIGFYDDSVNNLLVAMTNPKPNRDNFFLHCTARSTTKFAGGSVKARGFLTWGTVDTRFSHCVAEGLQTSANDTTPGFELRSQSLNTVLDSCTTVECHSGILIDDAIGTKFIAYRSWFDAAAGMIFKKASDIAIVGGEIVDTGVSGVLSGVGVYIIPTYAGATTLSRFRAYGLQFTTSGLTTSPIYGVAPLSVQPYQFNTATEANLFTNVEFDSGTVSGWSASPSYLFVAGTLKHNVIFRSISGINPIGLLATPFDNTNNYIGAPGVSATLTSAKVYTCTLTPIDIFWTGGTVTAQAKNGTAIPQGAASVNYVHLEPGDTYSITFSVTPTTYNVYAE